MEKCAQSQLLHVSLVKKRHPRCMSMIWFSYNTSKSGDEQISMKETCGLCEGNAEQHSFTTTLLSALWLVSDKVTQLWLRIDT